MKALTIYQPFASLLAVGEKRFETRGWATKHRGPIAIHAGRRMFELELDEDLRAEVFKPLLSASGEHIYAPTGAVIATAELVGIWAIQQGEDGKIKAYRVPDEDGATTAWERFREALEPTPKEIALGDWRPGRYAWELANVRPLPHPEFIKGKQGLWTWEPANK